MKGMVYQYSQFGKILNAYGKHTGHPGYAWAITREAMDILDGLIDFSIVGSADFQMACCIALANILIRFKLVFVAQSAE